MCSSTDAQLDRVCLAIEELADCSAGDRITLAERSQTHDDREAGDVATRLAAIWAMVADADPELARRLPGYMI
jgi:hypothetical protein